MRAHYRRRRDLLVEALADALPEATVHGIAAGLHATVQLPADHDEQAILHQARRRRIDLTTMRDFWFQPGSGPPTLRLGTPRSPSTPSPQPSASSPKRPERRTRAAPKGWRVVDPGLVVSSARNSSTALEWRSRLTRCTQSSWA
jgi:hypothetical protein